MANFEKEQGKSRGYDEQLVSPIRREEATNEIHSYKARLSQLYLYFYRSRGMGR